MKFKFSAVAFALSGPVLLQPVFAEDISSAEVLPERIAITGSHIKRVDQENATPLLLLTGDEIRQSGKVTLTDVLRDLTINSGNSFDEQYTGSFSAGSASIGLRGLSPKNTLVLVNGQRVSSYGFALNTQDNFVDLNALPLSSVERVEVLKDGASAVYGSDAIAGVVNIILKKDYQQTSLSAAAGNATAGGLAQYSAGLVTGIGDVDSDGYNLSLSLDWFSREHLTADQRDLLKSGDFRHLPGGRLAGWSTAGGAFLANPALPVPVTNCPQGSILRPRSDFATPGSGQTGSVCAFNTQPFNSLQPEVTRRQASINGTFQLNDQWQATAEVLYSYNDSAMTFGAPLTVGPGLRAYQQSSGSLVDIATALPVGHPDNPSNKALPFEYTLFDLGPRLKSNNQIFNRVLAGLKYQGEDWDININALQSSSLQREYAGNFVNRYEFEKALANGSYRFDGRQNSAEVLDKLRLQTRRPGQYQLSSLNLTASTILLELPYGPLGFASGVDLRRETMDAGTSPEVLSGTELRPAINLVKGERELLAGFAEFSVPLYTDLTASVAGRADHYDDSGSAVSPKLGLHYVLSDDWLLRGSWSRGFRAPSLPEIADSNTISYGTVIDPKDPLEPGSRRGFTSIRSGNNELQAERSNNLNAGVIWSFQQHASIGVDVFRIEQDQIIGPDNAQYIINNESLFADRIRRDAQGRLQLITNQYKNQGTRTTSGFDIDANYQLQLAGGHQLKFKTVWSRLLDYKQALVAGQPEIDGAGNNQFGALPDWRGNSSVNWQHGDWQANLSADFTSGYRQKVVTASSNLGLKLQVASYTQWNSQVNYLGFTDTVLTLSVNNLLDRDPPFDVAAGGDYFDTSLYNLRGRVVNLSVNYQF
ncbi:TonB-dependent receptor [Rheinheimera riviphila]|uniref:TonB-dependent receptor n=1 Tax=Rheinheimera riviphila TaxID=1834037 RepID=A0A437R069_9GAMM|nr:TonB-dependent receptor [Rheinheimera riviphila]RVU40130.1 TonB-dependent receptor [Rheinheimera riviphila]